MKYAAVLLGASILTVCLTTCHKTERAPQAPALAQQRAWNLEPKDFHGVAFGASRKALRQAHPDAECVEGTVSTDTLCYYAWVDPSVHAGAKGQLTVGVYSLLDRDKLVQIELSFSKDQFPAVRDLFLVRYGDPTPVTMSAVVVDAPPRDRNALRWVGKSIGIDLVRDPSSDASRLPVIAQSRFNARDYLARMREDLDIAKARLAVSRAENQIENIDREYKVTVLEINARHAEEIRAINRDRVGNDVNTASATITDRSWRQSTATAEQDAKQKAAAKF
jgi:hypothetical protein